MTTEVLIWITAGIILIFLEFILPGLVSVFLGISALCVGLMIHFGWISGPLQTFGIWMALSILLIMTIRQLAAKFYLSDEEYNYQEEDDEAVGKEVDVTETIRPTDSKGRIRFQGTDWPARSTEDVIRKGGKAVITSRDNISWIVKKTARNSKLSK